jgi:hypothetical protein
MSDDDLKQGLKRAFHAAEGKPPSFAKTFLAAQSRHTRRRTGLRAIAGIAAAVAIVAVSILLWPAQQAEMSDEFLIAESLLNSTSWSAPSDSLLPEHQFDIYQDIPRLDGSTISREGTLL